MSSNLSLSMDGSMKTVLVRLILVYNAPNDRLMEGEPLICDGLELPLKHRKKRIDLEARGLTKGANVIYLGPGKKAGFSRLFVVGSESPIPVSYTHLTLPTILLV